MVRSRHFMLASSLCVVAPASTAALAQAAPLPEASGRPIGYPTVAAAFSAVKANPNVKLSTKAGWTVGVDDTTNTFWSFPPPGNPAYPAAVKRHLVDKPEGIFIEMVIACEAKKAACDKLVADFKALNASMSKRFNPK